MSEGLNVWVFEGQPGSQQCRCSWDLAVKTAGLFSYWSLRITSVGLRLPYSWVKRAGQGHEPAWPQLELEEEEEAITGTSYVVPETVGFPFSIQHLYLGPYLIAK